MYERVGFTFPSCVKRHLQASSISLCLLMEKMAFYLRVKARKCLVGTLFLRLQLETVPPFYVVIRATRRSCCLQGKGSIFISQLL